MIPAQIPIMKLGSVIDAMVAFRALNAQLKSSRISSMRWSFFSSSFIIPNELALYEMLVTT